jgi:hypothetical protein
MRDRNSFSPDSNGKHGAKKSSFSCYRKATKGSFFYSVEKHFFGEDLKWKAGLASRNRTQTSLLFRNY